MGKFGSGLHDSLVGDYTVEERRGVDKYLARRALSGLIAAVVLLTVIISARACTACERSECVGTWVLLEDYSDGYDSGDCYVELRNGVTLYRNGYRIGGITFQNGNGIVERNSVVSSSRDMDFSIKLTVEGENLILEYNDYFPLEGTVNEMLMPSLTEPRVITETYIRISRDCELTPEQCAELY